MNLQRFEDIIMSVFLGILVVIIFKLLFNPNTTTIIVSK